MSQDCRLSASRIASGVSTRISVRSKSPALRLRATSAASSSESSMSRQRSGFVMAHQGSLRVHRLRRAYSGPMDRPPGKPSGIRAFPREGVRPLHVFGRHIVLPPRRCDRGPRLQRGPGRQAHSRSAAEIAGWVLGLNRPSAALGHLRDMAKLTHQPMAE